MSGTELRSGAPSSELPAFLFPQHVDSVADLTFDGS